MSARRSPNPFSAPTAKRSRRPSRPSSTNQVTSAPPSYSPSTSTSPLSIPALQSPNAKVPFTLDVDQLPDEVSGKKGAAQKDVAATPAPKYEVEGDLLQYLRMFDTVILMDDSGSMFDSWAEAMEACIHIANIAAEYDQDGVDLYFLNWEMSFHNITNREAMTEAFKEVRELAGMTPLGACLKRVLDSYIQEYRDKRAEDEELRLAGRKQRAEAQKSAAKPKGSFFGRLLRRKSSVKREEPAFKAALPKADRAQRQRRKPMYLKPINVIVITDGAPTDNPECVLRDITLEMDSLQMSHNQIGVQFVQIGNCPEATQYLERLDDNLGNGLRDIVDTVKWNGERLDDPNFIAKILLGGIIRRIDDVKDQE